MGDQNCKSTSENKDFIALVAALDQSLWESYELKLIMGNNIMELNPNVVIYLDDVAIAALALRNTI
jgi:hypothetical protein